MANQLGNFNTPLYAVAALDILMGYLGAPKRVNRRYEEERKAFGRGETVNIRRPSTFTVYDAPLAAGSVDDLATESVAITLNQYKETKFKVTDREIATSTDAVIKEHIRPMAYAHANAIDRAILAQSYLIPHCQQITASSISTPAAWRHMRNSVLAGDNALDASGVWWKAPLALAGGMTAAAGTAGLIKHVSNRIASGNRKAKEEEARAAFENALAKSLKPVMTKAASDEDLGDKLVTLFSLMTKSAAFDDAMASALKMYGLYAVGTGLGAGALAYSSSRNKKLKALKQAVSARQAGQLRSQPTEITLPGISSAPLANTVE